MPRVAVVIPTRNRPAFLEEAVASVLGQDYRDLEVLVVDDGSEDPGANIRVVERCDGPVRYVRRERRGGPSAARNTGIAASDSEFVAFLDDDDVWLPSKLGRQVRVFDGGPPGQDRLGVVYCGHLWIEATSGRVQVRRMPHIRTTEDLFRARYNIIQTVLVRRSCIEEVGGFDENMAFQENLEFLVRVSQRWHFGRVDEELVWCRTHSGPRTGDDLGAIIDGYRRLLTTARAAGMAPSVLHGDYYRLGRALMAAGSMAAAREYLAEAVRGAPYTAKGRYAAFLGLSYVVRAFTPSLREAFVRSSRRR
ncbi:MAG: glycosyltransferase [Armatimonadota bacterium]|nr:glycosyltransferase [Armatimonadota bacterium]